ncbi:MAG TPA: hypothetical protein VHH36_08035 [Candidatus Thermoplasmatota archaeon]|nr:hypothetical protein [Candidatus Thermoplasmatota archaeon]
MRLRALAAALLLAAPLGAATWRVPGSFEPDTPHDVEGAYGWPDPDVAPGGYGRVYFNAMAGSGVRATDNAAHGAVRPNVHDSRVAPPASPSFVALLGAWKDCDLDGYVGSAKGAVWHYRAELLPAGSPCVDGPHVIDGWVWEFLQIGSERFEGGGYQAGPKRGIRDPGANVWGDFGAPGAAAHVECPRMPMPPGTLSGTGPLLGYADCFAGHAVARGVNALDDGALGLRFADPDRPGADCSSALSRDLGLFARDRCAGRTGAFQENSGDPAFTTWDCADPHGGQNVRDPTATGEGRGALPPAVTDADGYVLRAPEPAPRVRDPAGSWYDALNETATGPNAGAHQGDGCGSPRAPFAATRIPDKLAFALLEGSRGGATDDVKRAPDVPMRYQSGDFVDEPNAFAALEATRQAYPYGWVSIHATDYGPPGYGGGLTRDDAQPSGPVWTTFYANVTRATTDFARLRHVPSVYGEEVCANGLAEARRWDCEPTRWWDPAHGARSRPLFVIPAVVGQPYMLRDVDCYDGTVAPGLPRASLVDASGEAPCPAP